MNPWIAPPPIPDKDSDYTSSDPPCDAGWLGRVAFILLLATALMAALAYQAQAAEVTLSWEVPAESGWIAVRIYELGADGTRTLVAEAKADESGAMPTLVTISDVTAGEHLYVARAYNGHWESSDESEPVSTKPVPGNVGKLTITVTTTITTKIEP